MHYLPVPAYFFLNMFAFRQVESFPFVLFYLCANLQLWASWVRRKRISMASYSPAASNSDTPISQGARCFILRQFFLGNVYRNAKLWFVADVSLASTAFLYSICVVNIFNFPDVVRKLWTPVLGNGNY